MNDIIILFGLFLSSFCLLIIILIIASFVKKNVKTIENYIDNIRLSNTSVGMISFLNCDDYNYEDINEETKNVLKDFHSKFNESISDISKIVINDGYVATNKETNNFLKPKEFNIIPELLQNDINTNLIYQTVYKYNIFDKEITIYISEETYNIEEYNECVKRMLILFSTYLKYSTQKCSNKLSIFLFFSKLKKSLPEYGEQMERHNLNNAYTYPCSDNSELIIYRKEEWFKVFCHESMHNLGLDFSVTDDTISKDLILQIFPIKSNVRLYEAYTETWAKIMNCVFSATYEYNDSFDEFINRFNYLICKERIFAILQTVKILNYMGLKYQDLYDTNSNNRDKLYYEKTYLISYFVINAILLNNYQEFINWCLKNNVNVLQFDNENYEKKQMLLCAFIKDYHKSEMIIKRFDFTLNDYIEKKSENYSDNLNIFMTTLKKSVVERNI
jgi:hypothetical protein